MSVRKKKSAGKKTARKVMTQKFAQAQESAPQHHLTSASHALEKACNHWQFGDWASLSKLQADDTADQPELARIQLYAAAGHLQLGQFTEARGLIDQAKAWGVPASELRRVLISGVYNSLSRARLIQGSEQAATMLMQSSCRVGMPNGDNRWLLAVRLAFQAAQIGLPQPTICSAVEAWPRPVRERLASAKKHLQPSGDSEDLTNCLLEILKNLTDHFLRQGRDMALDGVRVFETHDPFRPGKLALAMSYRVTACEPGSAEELRACHQFDRMAELTGEDPQETWGIYFYLCALVRLKSRGLLEKTLAPFRLDQLRERLDWRGFIEQPTYLLKELPNNFYGVAFSIAGHRAALGWEDPMHAEILLEKMLHTYRTHSGQHGFADEIEGEGLYDRYSVLLIAEIAHRFRETGRPLTSEMQTRLRSSAQFVLCNLNKNGDGFQFGRSIGAFGDSAFLEILSAAAWHGVLTAVETRMAYAFARRATRKFLDFWHDGIRQSVNLWEDGRATDGYRNKQRILGETISLLHQHIYTHRVWQQLKLKPTPELQSEFDNWLAELPRATLTRFVNNRDAKAALTVRDGDRLFSLWLVNPAKHHDNGAYAPTPFSSSLIQAVPGANIHPLVPLIELDDGSQLRPMAYFDAIYLEESGERTILHCRQSALATVHKGKLRPDARVSVQTRFEFSPGRLCRKDEFRMSKGCAIRLVRLCFPTTLKARIDQFCAKLDGDEGFTFQVEGYESLTVRSTTSMATPEGPIRDEILASTKSIQPKNDELTVSWLLNYC